jgi:hypothetical protein
MGAEEPAMSEGPLFTGGNGSGCPEQRLCMLHGTGPHSLDQEVTVPGVEWNQIEYSLLRLAERIE